MQTLHFDIKGMTCDDCADEVQYSLNKLSSVHQVKVDLMQGTLSLMPNTTLTPPSKISSVISRLGFTARLQDKNLQHEVLS